MPSPPHLIITHSPAARSRQQMSPTAASIAVLLLPLESSSIPTLWPAFAFNKPQLSPTPSISFSFPRAHSQGRSPQLCSIPLPQRCSMAAWDAVLQVQSPPSLARRLLALHSDEQLRLQFFAGGGECDALLQLPSHFSAATGESLLLMRNVKSPASVRQWMGRSMARFSVSRVFMLHSGSFVASCCSACVTCSCCPRITACTWCACSHQRCGSCHGRPS